MWRISFWLFFSIGYIIINNSIKAGFNHYRPNRLHFHISIHAPRAGSDPAADVAPVTTLNISIHAPRAGSDVLDASIVGAAPIFQSTLPVRGATTAPA